LRNQNSQQIRKAVDEEMLAPSRDIKGAQSVTTTYVLCGCQRTGSTLIASLLRDTGLAGDPLEYFNPYYIKQFADSAGITGRLDIGEYLRAMAARRTSPNGVFGMKLQLDQLLYVYGDEMRAANFLRQQSYLVRVRRREKLEQAISLYRAIRTGIFSTVHERYARKVGIDVSPPKFDAAKIAYLYDRVCKDDQAWSQLLEKYQLDFEEIFFEDFTKDIERGLRGLLSSIGINLAEFVLPIPILKRQSDSWNLEMKTKYLRHLGPEATT
jgi:LPS sulfotransferase NodH